MKILVRGRACHPTSVKIGAMAPSCVKISEIQIQNCLFVLSIVRMVTAHVRVHIVKLLYFSRQMVRGLLGCRGPGEIL